MQDKDNSASAIQPTKSTCMTGFSLLPPWAAEAKSLSKDYKNYKSLRF